jgi:hypothetical protein
MFDVNNALIPPRFYFSQMQIIHNIHLTKFYTLVIEREKKKSFTTYMYVCMLTTYVYCTELRVYRVYSQLDLPWMITCGSSKVVAPGCTLI